MFTENGFAEDEKSENEEGRQKNAKGDETGVEALGAEAHEQEDGEAENDGRNGLEHQVVGGRGFELGVDFAEKNHAVAGGAGEHAEHREEAFIGIVGIEIAGAGTDIEESGNGAKDTYQNQGQPKTAEVAEVDGGGTCNYHEVETGAGQTVEGEVVDIFALHQFVFAETVDDYFYQHTQQSAPQEIEAPHHRLERFGAELAKVELLDTIHEEEDKEIDQKDKADLDSELVDRLGMGNLVVGLVVLQGVGFFVVGILFTEQAFAAQDIHIQHTHYATYYETSGSNAESEIGTLENDALTFGPTGVGDAEIECLSRSLAIAHRQEETRGIEELAIVQEQKQGNGDHKSDKALEDVGAGGDRTCLYNLHGGGGTLDFLILECHSDKAETQGMVGDNLHGGLVDHEGEKAKGLETKND